MSMTATTPARANAVLLAGAFLAIAAAVFGFARAFMTDPGMAMGPAPAGGAAHPLHGMPLSEMPEMPVAAIGVLLALAGAVLRSRVAAARAAPVPRARRALIAVVGTAGLTIDISKTSTLGFVIPGMRAEYGLGAGQASLLAVGGLAGTAAGAVLFGHLADRLGRRGPYLVATLGFTTTSLCGTMPDFTGNVVMCVLMGLSVGGLAPLLVTVLTDEVGGGRARGPVVVALSVVATAVGYLVAAASALWLEPVFGWRVLWLIGAPTGLALVLLTPLLPDRSAVRDRPAGPVRPPDALSAGVQRIYAALVGLLTFGLTTWVPTLARAGGISVHTGNLLLTVAAVVMVPASLLVMLAYTRFGPVALAVALAGATAVLLFTVSGGGAASAVAWVSGGALAAALFSVNTMAAVFLPITADLSGAAGRGRATGTVSLFNRLGGLCGPVVLAALVSSTSGVLLAVAILAAACALAACCIGVRQRRLKRVAGDIPEGVPETSGRR
jgi:hypothetical protein